MYLFIEFNFVKVRNKIRQIFSEKIFYKKHYIQF